MCTADSTRRSVRSVAYAAAVAIYLAGAAAFAEAPSRGDAAAADSAATAPPDVGDEIIVRAKNRAAIRAALVRAQDRLYAIYNSINASDELDIHCYLEKRYASNIKERVCKPNYARTADQQYAQDLLTGLQGGYSAAPEAAYGYKAYQESLLLKDWNALLAKHPELLGAFIEFATLRDAQYADKLPAHRSTTAPNTADK